MGSAVLLVLCGCTATTGQTNLSLHQYARFADGTRFLPNELEVSSQKSDRPIGNQKVPAHVVTVWLDVHNSGKPVNASDVTLQLFYTDNNDREVQPAEVASSTNVIATGGRDRVMKTFFVATISQVFQSRHLRIVVQVPDYPTVTFTGPVP